MMRTLILVAFLAACSGDQPPVFAPVSVDMPVPIACKPPPIQAPIDQMAVLPAAATLTQALKACLTQTLDYRIYTDELSAALRSCE